MRFTHKFKALIVATAFVSSPIWAQSNGQTIDAAIDAAIASEPKFLAGQMSSSLETARLKNAKANEKSSIGIQGTIGASNADFGMGFDTIYPRALALAYEKRLYDGGQALARINAQEFQLAATNGENLNAKNLLIAEVAQAYANLYAAKKSVQYAADNLESSTRFARDARLQFEAGETPVSEKAFSEAALHRAAALKAHINGQYKLSQANLFRLTGLMIDAPTLSNVTPKLPASESMAKEYAKANHPLLAAAKARVAQADAQFRLANGANKPVVSVSARAQSVRDQFLAGYQSDEVGAYLNFAMPIFTNGRISSARDMARAGKEQARFALLAAERGIEMNISQAYINYETALAQKSAAIAAQSATELAMKSVEAEMRAGQRPMADVLDARKNLTEAMMEVAKAESDVLAAKYKIIAATGGEN